MGLKLGLPSKGRLQEQCIDWFANRGIAIRSSVRTIVFVDQPERLELALAFRMYPFDSLNQPVLLAGCYQQVGSFF